MACRAGVDAHSGKAYLLWGMNRRISNKEPQNFEGKRTATVRLHFAVRSSGWDILRFLARAFSRSRERLRARTPPPPASFSTWNVPMCRCSTVPPQISHGSPSARMSAPGIRHQASADLASGIRHQASGWDLGPRASDLPTADTLAAAHCSRDVSPHYSTRSSGLARCHVAARMSLSDRSATSNRLQAYLTENCA